MKRIIDHFKTYFDEYFIISILAFIILIAVNTQIGWLYVISSFLGAVLLISFIIPAVNISGIDVKRYHNETVELDEFLNIELSVRNNSRLTKHFFLIQDNLPFDEDPLKNIIVEQILPKEVLRFSYKAKACIRGVYNIGSVSLSTGLPFNLFWRKRIMKCHSRCIVYPSVVKLKKQIKGRYNQFSPNLSLSYNIKGLGFDLYSIRDYITGDELKRIHWPVSARFCQLMVKEFNTYSKNHVNILLDNNRFSSIGKGRENSFEYLVKIAVSLCRKFFDEKISMKLIYQEKSGFRMINYNHFEDFMLFFAGITADGKYSVNDLIRWFIQEQAIKGSCLIISVDPEISLDLINSVNKLKKGSDIILIKGSDFRYSDEKIYESDRYDRNIQMLCKSGINLQVISKGDDLSSCLVS